MLTVPLGLGARAGLQGATTRAGVRRSLSRSLSTFGLLALLVQTYSALWPDAPPRAVPVLVLMLAASAIAGVLAGWPRALVSHHIAGPDVTVRVVVGDLFSRGGSIVVGFSDTFDTDTTGDQVISRSSVQGQLLERAYRGDVGRLDADLKAALGDAEPAEIEEHRAKPLGKLERYPIGTTVRLPRDGGAVFGVAYGRMGNDLVVSSSTDDLWRSLSALWDRLYLELHRQPIAMPVVGSGLARIDSLSRQSILCLILLSFVERCRTRSFTSELTVVVHPDDVADINLADVDDFLRVLARS